MEFLGVTARAESIEFAPVITNQTGISSAVWTKQPITFRDDELSIVEQTPDETPVYSHEMDAPADISITGKGSIFKGSFFAADQAQLLGLLGGAVTAGTYYKSGTKIPLATAIRVTLKDGSQIVMPYAKGYVVWSSNIGASKGTIKFPFQFNVLTQSGWDCDLAITPAP